MSEINIDTFFEDIDYVAGHFIGHFNDEDEVKEELKWIFKKYHNKQALKLEELVKEEVSKCNHRGHKSPETYRWSLLFAQRLQNLLEESEQ